MSNCDHSILLFNALHETIACPYCRIKELEAWEDIVRRCAPEVAQVADSEAVEKLIGKK